MIQLYLDGDRATGRLAYDSRLQDYALLGLKTTTGLNKSGTATIIMPPDHPAFSAFVSFRTVVNLYEDGVRRFRGRALNPEDDNYGCRTVTCEGERGFFLDAIIRPYLYQDDPAEIFRRAIGLYNAAVDEFKRFEVGTITVTDPNNYIRLESSNAETFGAFIDKLVERCGGYITFDDNPETGARRVNWLAEIGTQSGQTIEFGENLLEFSRSGASPDLATAILPYGAMLETEGSTEGESSEATDVEMYESKITRVTIESVTPDGRDWIQDDEAVALRGVIMASVTWDDVTEPANLLAKAEQWLREHRLAITSLRLTAVDLSKLDKRIDRFHEGDRVRVVSRPHGVDDWFQLTDRETDWLDPASGVIDLGKTSASLVGGDVAGDRHNASVVDKVKHEIVSDYQANIAKAVEETELTLRSLIQQTATSIMLEVSETYARGDDVTSLVESRITQLADSISFTFTTLQTELDTIDGETRTKFTEIEKYIRFENGDIVLGESGNTITLRIENDRISFLDNGAEVAYLSDRKLYVTNGHFLNRLQMGPFAWIAQPNGHWSLVKEG